VSAEEGVARLLKVVKRTPGWLTPCAQYNLGGIYREGTGVRQDYVEAVKWYRLAADQGNAMAQPNLGAMYDNGIGVSYTEAVKWYRQAADQGDAMAQSNLGAMYDNGTGVRQDYAEAAKWYRLATDQGQAGAQ
jgi:TPR repeat protein